MLAVSTVAAATAVEVMKLDRYHFQMSPAPSTVRNDSRVGLSMNQVVGILVVSAFGFSAVSIAQAMGTSQSRAKAMRTPVHRRLNALCRLSYEAAVAASLLLRRSRGSLSIVDMVRPSFPADARWRATRTRRR